MTFVAELRRFADAIEAGDVEAPDVLMVSRVYHGDRVRTAVDFIDGERPGGQWVQPYASPPTVPDDGN